jgi:hypothetical protein
MIRLLTPIIALTCLLPFAGARADDFVLLSGFTEWGTNTCRAGLSNDVFNSYCNSTAYLFNKDTSDFYICTGGLQVNSSSTTGQITYSKITATCTKMAAPFPTPFQTTSKYTALAFQNSDFVQRSAHLAFGTAFWASENAALHVRVCYNLTIPVKYVGCGDDATIQ